MSLLFLVPARLGLELKWTQYSDLASMPHSLRAREELRDSLERVPLASLSEREGKKLRRLKALLDGALAEGEAAARQEGRKKRSWLDMVDRYSLSVSLVVLGASLVWGLRWRRSANASTLEARAAAARAAEGLAEAERSEARGRAAVPPAEKGAKVLSADTAQFLCDRLVAMLGLATTAGGKKQASATGPTLEALAATLARDFDCPQVEVIEKALRKERKKLRQKGEPEERPKLLLEVEAAWLQAVTQTWRPAAAALGGYPTLDHVQAWARNGALRLDAEREYREAVESKAFLQGY